MVARRGEGWRGDKIITWLVFGEQEQSSTPKSGNNSSVHQHTHYSYVSLMCAPQNPLPCSAAAHRHARQGLTVHAVPHLTPQSPHTPTPPHSRTHTPAHPAPPPLCTPRKTPQPHHPSPTSDRGRVCRRPHKDREAWFKGRVTLHGGGGGWRGVVGGGLGTTHTPPRSYPAKSRRRYRRWR